MKVLLTTRKGSNPFSWLIRKVMGTAFSHCCISYRDKGVDLVAESTMIKGVRVQTLENFLEQNTIIEEIKIKNKFNFDRALRFIYSQLGDKYSFWSLIGMWWNNDKIGADGDNAYNCSELLARAFNIEHQSLDHIDVLELKKLIEGH